MLLIRPKLFGALRSGLRRAREALEKFVPRAKRALNLILLAVLAEICARLFDENFIAHDGPILKIAESGVFWSLVFAIMGCALVVSFINEL